jgi:hypothetical protein
MRKLASDSEIDDEAVGFHAQQADELTIYAVPMRYDELLDAEPLEREATIALVGKVGGLGGHPTPLKLGPRNWSSNSTDLSRTPWT